MIALDFRPDLDRVGLSAGGVGHLRQVVEVFALRGVQPQGARHGFQDLR